MGIDPYGITRALRKCCRGRPPDIPKTRVVEDADPYARTNGTAEFVGADDSVRPRNRKDRVDVGIDPYGIIRALRKYCRGRPPDIPKMRVVEDADPYEKIRKRAKK